ncbi:hypothetical protein BVC80_1525g5 [Macleaya cordata]|uniref:Uncharacterized protein n=1 Tax=Macleaya cordata TaxID=56857 RepID=A0A200PMU7_MACCD|nr:hypothetical protein BVC80_1525g5 [Macleaya cordata]
MSHIQSLVKEENSNPVSSWALAEVENKHVTQPHLRNAGPLTAVWKLASRWQGHLQMFMNSFTKLSWIPRTATQTPQVLASNPPDQIRTPS